MKLAIIADDLTGANDSGVQLAQHGLKTSVLFDIDRESIHAYEAIVFDTDSRSIDREEAYQKVKDAAQFLKGAGFSYIFKKLDSTMRGNIGAEIDAVFDVLQPDFMMIAPGYPKNNRTILQSTHYLKGIPLAETEIARDPKTPVTQSYLPDLLKEQTKQKIGTITIDDLDKGFTWIQEKVDAYFQQKIPYILVDSTEEHHLEQILDYTKKLRYQFSWVGSAGIANYLPDYYDMPKRQKELIIPQNEGPILTVVGSVNKNSRAQLQFLMENTNVYPIAFESFKSVSDEDVREKEIRRVYNLAMEKAQQGLDVIIYSTGEANDIEKAWNIGETKGLTHTEVSNEIVKAIGSVCSVLLEKGYFKGVSMTGGDTAKQICYLWDVKGFELLDELEIGVPLSKFFGHDNLYVITKAGGFGTPEVFINAIKKLKGEL
ncbi:four-carbon acid sugar kinase family protein [Fredinandcohnia sp. QZ13]|uniref:four-carbon acid sugar kinase family protein n=1 Tax=Fredinandcohnia sp. QZ13 TaxID=3073144 RepID=UPI0028531166|nr:four-carbon acid sugar kinase family protein [Fredinandcohnia sp. QZ13]MDR4890280.1 four-carbon acid sugar kinase family protein [Fredinandcohnia sp. QZ13]